MCHVFGMSLLIKQFWKRPFSPFKVFQPHVKVSGLLFQRNKKNLFLFIVLGCMDPLSFTHLQLVSFKLFSLLFLKGHLSGYWMVLSRLNLFPLLNKRFQFRIKYTILNLFSTWARVLSFAHFRLTLNPFRITILPVRTTILSKASSGKHRQPE